MAADDESRPWDPDEGLEAARGSFGAGFAMAVALSAGAMGVVEFLGLMLVGDFFLYLGAPLVVAAPLVQLGWALPIAAWIRGRGLTETARGLTVGALVLTAVDLVALIATVNRFVHSGKLF
jgi:hypothetical protein